MPSQGGTRALAENSEMLSITHLGHSGWLCQSEKNVILVDPLLNKEFGRGPEGARMPPLWPPRVFSIEDFPPIDAVVISHEHEDHFNVPSLAKVDRSIPIYLPIRSSFAASSMVKEMGFECRHLTPNVPVRFGTLELVPLSPDFVAQDHLDEWDVLALFFRNTVQGGSFFTTVDVTASEQMIRQLESQGDQGVLFHRHGVLIWTQMQNIRAAAFGEQNVGSEMEGDACEALNSGKLRNIVPGESVSVSDSRVLSFRENMPFLRTSPRSTWGFPPAWRSHPNDADYLPACGHMETNEADLEMLDTGLSELSQHMYGGRIFKALYSVYERHEDFKASFLLLLIADSDRHYYALEYRPSECSFQSVETQHPLHEYMCGVECWATDLAALFRGDFEPRILSLGHSRHWSRNPMMPDCFQELIWPFFHPLRRPQQCLNRYREQFRSVGSARILISKNEAAARKAHSLASQNRSAPMTWCS